MLMPNLYTIVIVHGLCDQSNPPCPTATSRCRANSYKRPGLVPNPAIPVPRPAPGPAPSPRPSSTDPRSKPLLRSLGARSHRPQALEPMAPYPMLRLLSQVSFPSTVLYLFVLALFCVGTVYSCEGYDVTSSVVESHLPCTTTAELSL